MLVKGATGAGYGLLPIDNKLWVINEIYKRS